MDLLARALPQLDEARDERDRQVVDAEEAEVLEGVDRLGAPGPGHACDHHDLRRRTAVGTLIVGNSALEWKLFV